LLLRGRDISVQLHPWNELYSGEHHGNEKPGSFIPSVRVPAQQERHLKREATAHLSLGQRIPSAELAERPLQFPPSDTEVCFSVLSRRSEEKEEYH
jgi:hypothetical protein